MSREIQQTTWCARCGATPGERCSFPNREQAPDGFVHNARAVRYHENRCDYRSEHDLVTDTPTGDRCTAQATHVITWSDGRYSRACDAHLEIDASATVMPASIATIGRDP